MAHPLDGCWAKIVRADQHVEEFISGTRAFFDHAPYRVTGEINDEAGELILRAESDPDFPPVPTSLCLIAGEVAHQLRSALDHLVWQLVIANQQGHRPESRADSRFF